MLTVATDLFLAASSLAYSFNGGEEDWGGAVEWLRVEGNAAEFPKTFVE